MSRVNADTFNRLLVERGLTVRKFQELSGLSFTTIARIRRGDKVSVATIESAASVFENTAPRPLFRELIAS